MFYHLIITNTTYNGDTKLQQYFEIKNINNIVKRFEVAGNNHHWHYLIQDKDDSTHNIHRFCKRWFGSTSRVSLKLIKSRDHLNNVWKYIKQKPKTNCDLPRRASGWLNYRSGGRSG